MGYEKYSRQGYYIYFELLSILKVTSRNKITGSSGCAKKQDPQEPTWLTNAGGDYNWGRCQIRKVVIIIIFAANSITCKNEFRI